MEPGDEPVYHMAWSMGIRLSYTQAVEHGNEAVIWHRVWSLGTRLLISPCNRSLVMPM